MPEAAGVLTVAGSLREGRCRAAEDGAPCCAEAWLRGLCERHYQLARARGLLGRIGLAPRQLKHDIRLKTPEELQPGLCRVVVNGQPCPLPGKRRGLCLRHYAAIWQRPDLRLDDFALGPITSGDYCLRRRVVSGQCRVAENGQGCGQKVFARWLCEHHLAVLRHRPELFAQIALASRAKPWWTPLALPHQTRRLEPIRDQPEISRLHWCTPRSMDLRQFCNWTCPCRFLSPRRR